MVKQVFSHSFGMDQQGTKGEGDQPAQPVKAGSEVPELHSIRSQRCCSRGGEQSREEEDSNGKNSPKPSPSETVSLLPGTAPQIFRASNPANHYTHMMSGLFLPLFNR